MMRKRICFRQLILAIVLLNPLLVAAQTTEFTYQGKLVDGALPANANYDFEFRLFATTSGGSAIATQTRLGVPVANGIFTVPLDFGGQFDGSARWLEIAVKPAGSPNPLTVLTPRQSLNSTPYSIRSLSSARADVATNSLQLGGVNASQYVLTTDARMTDARSPLPNSANYVQNTTAPQSSSNFNISGDGTAGGTLSANAVNATTQFNLGGNRILSGLGNNLFAGVGAGAVTVGGDNSFYGRNAGLHNTGGSDNSFFGVVAGRDNTLGSRNSLFGVGANRSGQDGNDNAIFGYSAGLVNEGNSNSFFGSMVGKLNTTGHSNSFFGKDAGLDNTSGGGNSFFGFESGNENKTGEGNSFFGYATGTTNTTGNNNTLIGISADVGSGNLSNATAIGSGAVVNTSNTIVLGRSADTVRVPGPLNVSGSTIINDALLVSEHAIFSDTVAIALLGSAGGTDVCRNASNFLSTCSSSLRYKTDIQPFTGGLNLVNRLRSISFSWKDGGLRDVGFAAEEVEQVEPLLVTYKSNGEIEGVKYKQLTTVLVNAVKEQQANIEAQQKQINEQTELIKGQQTEIDALKVKVSEVKTLKKLVCQQDPTAEICKGKQ